MHPLNDKIKVKPSAGTMFSSGDNIGRESGVVIEVPDEMTYFGFHSFAFEGSIANQDVLKSVLGFYKKLEGKTVFWESLQDAGRHFKDKETSEEFVILNMSDIIGWAEDGVVIESINQVGSAGAFNLS